MINGSFGSIATVLRYPHYFRFAGNFGNASLAGVALDVTIRVSPTRELNDAYGCGQMVTNIFSAVLDQHIITSPICERWHRVSSERNK